MLKNNRKAMFSLLLIPTYLAIVVILIGLQVGSIEWGMMLPFITMNVISAWLLSFKKNILFNFIGSLYFIAYGWNWFAIIFNPPLDEFPPALLPWETGIYFGSGFMLIGILALIYGLLKRASDKKIAEI